MTRTQLAIKANNPAITALLLLGFLWLAHYSYAHRLEYGHAYSINDIEQMNNLSTGDHSSLMSQENAAKLVMLYGGAE